MKAQNVKVTTASGFDGVDIEEYLEPITAHVVDGMNFFKDFLSGFSDFFGGKSKTSQNTLASINDEVSAQGKSMMMGTALGTAAKANLSKKHLSKSRGFMKFGEE